MNSSSRSKKKTDMWEQPGGSTLRCQSALRCEGPEIMQVYIQNFGAVEVCRGPEPDPLWFTRGLFGLVLGNLYAKKSWKDLKDVIWTTKVRAACSHVLLNKKCVTGIGVDHLFWRFDDGYPRKHKDWLHHGLLATQRNKFTVLVIKVEVPWRFWGLIMFNQH